MISKEEISAHLHRLIPTDYRDILDAKKIEQSIDNEYNYLNRMYSERDYGINFHKLCPVESALSEDYMGKRFHVNDIALHTTIRFKNRDIDFPFVEIDCYSSDLKTLIDSFQDLKSKMKELYQVFKPLCIRMMIREEDIDQIPSWICLRTDLGMYACPIEIARSYNYDLDGARVVSISSLAEKDYLIYLDEYNRFNKSYPELTSANPEPIDKLNACAEKGILVKLFVKNEWAGLGAYTSYDDLFLYGYLVWDKIVFEKFRGKNLSAYMHQRLYPTMLQ